MPRTSNSSRWFVAIAGLLYFSEGFPYGIVKELLPLYLRLHHVSLESIGLISSVGLAWTLKFLWSPLVDAFGTYRNWIAGALAVAALSLGGMAILPEGVSTLFFILIVVLALASATQDIAVDAFTIRTTPPSLLGPVNSIRVTAYRGAVIVAGGALAAIGGRAGWRAAFATAALVAVVILAVTRSLPPDRGEAGRRMNLIGDLAHWLQRPRAGILLAIAFLYRIGEFAVVTMIKPYWVDRGYSAAEIGTITSVIGVIVSIAGAIAGGALIAKLGLYRGLLLLGAAQSVSNLGYALVATAHAGRWAIYAAAITENLGFGLGTAAFLAFLMSICDRERAATEYALLSAAYGLTGTGMAAVSGFLAHAAGYPVYFWITVFLGIPSLLLIPLVREQIEPVPNPAASS